MEEAAEVRAVVFETIDDIEPEPFRAELETVLEDAALAPGVLTVRTAHALSETGGQPPARQRGAAVQLSYEGLKLTRQLARDAPWELPEGGDDHDIDLIVAETLVARGFFHLANTGVATRAVDILRRFGRNLTTELQLEESPTEASLEVDVVTLAIVAGADLALPHVPPSIVDFAEEYASSIEAVPLPDPETLPPIGGDLKTRLAGSDRVTVEDD